MRGDYYKPGPPWKAIFRDKKGFIHQEINQDKLPPQEYFFLEVDEHKGSKRIVFELCGKLGNIAIYKER